MRGADVLAILRGDPAARPEADPCVVEAARGHLEAAAAAWAEAIPTEAVVRVTKDAVSSVRRCEARHLAELAERLEPREPPAAVVRGRLLDALFRQVATIGTVGADPMADALAGCETDGDPAAASLARLDAAERRQVREEVVAAAERLVAAWPSLPSGAGLRTQERVVVALAGGRVLLSGRPDLTIGRPTRHRAGVLVVEAKSGGFRPAHLDELRFYALLEALRWRVAPFRVVVWCLGDGRIEGIDVDADLVWSEALRVADAITRLTRLAAGEPARTSGNPLCPSCPLVTRCADGGRQVALAGGGWPVAPEADPPSWPDGPDDPGMAGPPAARPGGQGLVEVHDAGAREVRR